MNQKTLTGIMVILVVIGGAFVISNKGGTKEATMVNKDRESDAMLVKEDKAVAEKEAMADKDATMKESNENISKTENTMTKSGTYEIYVPEKVALASSTHKVVLFFRASWCPTCRALDKDIKANLSSIPKDLTILDVDYDNSTELKKKYGVTYQHTLVEVDKDGKLIKKWLGSPDLSSLVKEAI